MKQPFKGSCIKSGKSHGCLVLFGVMQCFPCCPLDPAKKFGKSDDCIGILHNVKVPCRQSFDALNVQIIYCFFLDLNRRKINRSLLHCWSSIYNMSSSGSSKGLGNSAKGSHPHTKLKCHSHNRSNKGMVKGNHTGCENQ